MSDNSSPMDKSTEDVTDHDPIQYLTVHELQLFVSDDPNHSGAFDDYSHEESCSEANDDLSDSLINGLINIELTADDYCSLGEICELHVYEVRHDSRGQKVTLQVDATEDLDIPIDRSTDVALVLFRNYDSSRVLQSTSLEIRSPHMRTILKSVIKSYPGVNLHSTGVITIQGTPRCLFHYRSEIQAFAEESDDDNIKEHAEFLLKYMRRTLQKELTAYETFIETNEQDPGLDFDNLWMAYKPGELIFRMIDVEPSLYRLRSMALKRPQFHSISPSGTPAGGPPQMIDVPLGLPTLPGDYWRLELDMIQCDGKDFGYTTTPAIIDNFDGYKPLRDLAIFPFEYHQERDRLKSDLIARGRFFLNLHGTHHMVYQDVSSISSLEESDNKKSLGNRIIVDCQQFLISNGLMCVFNPGSKVIYTSQGDHLALSDEEVLICSQIISGFSLDTKSWSSYKLRCLSHITFDHTAFQKLVLPPHQKTLIQSLVKEHQSKQSTVQDLIQGKGNGLIFLLHGEPGVGKTLTAESLAELTERPLYTIGCGDLGTSSSMVEQAITKTLALAHKWNALVLLDEADVFMEQRNSNELSRNELVSVLLRVLEYSNCIMFLTTNRVQSIDSAFKSRIHLALYYPRLSFQARRQIWNIFLEKAVGSESPYWLNRKFYNEVATYDINGRQIKNIIRMSCAIAANKHRALQRQDIVDSLEAFVFFEREFKHPSPGNRFWLDCPQMFIWSISMLFICIAVGIMLRFGGMSWLSLEPVCS